MNQFMTPLRVVEASGTANQGRGEWVLETPLSYVSDVHGTFTVPAGFATDFASVPRLPFAYLLVGGTASRAAALHDWLYSTPGAVPDRATADALLREAALADGVPAWRAWLLWVGVRLFGASHWQPDVYSF